MEFQLIRSGRKTLSVEILRDGHILVRAPYLCPRKEILAFLQKNESYILKKQKEMLLLPKPKAVSKEELEIYREKLKKTLYDRLSYWSDLTGLSYHSVRVTSARTRFGSCSGQNSLSFSLYLALASADEIDYVILHELCHTREHNHSKRFYRLVAQYMPDWKEREKKLKQIVIPYVEDQIAKK